MKERDAPFGGSLSAYHADYRKSPRERDKVGLSILERIRKNTEGNLKIVDVGAGWGSFAYLIDKNIDNCAVSMIEIDEECVKFADIDPELSQIDAILANIVDTPLARKWDVASTVAVTCMFPQHEFESLMTAVSQLIKPGGYYVGWEMFHHIDQELEIKETHQGDSCLLCIRSIEYVANFFKSIGLNNIEFIPFEMPFDMAPVTGSIAWAGKSTDIRAAHLKSHTVNTDDGRYSFRGSMYQPWCHVIARKD
ncbi:MAG: hypothetical protein CMM59_16495 [Rhodospirillaceae bacterium]|nr:hypothetical protein [Rhodospirillaceae bacterium]|tara:strand:- start:3832 stop:4584 length:753 start_codon:yes stop_codon:yes gene_type:complete